jgi:hypothetical protein
VLLTATSEIVFFDERGQTWEVILHVYCSMKKTQEVKRQVPEYYRIECVELVFRIRTCRGM